MLPKLLLAGLAAVALAACSDDDDGGAATPAGSGPTAGCPVAQASVAEALGHPVSVERGNESGACAYVTGDGASTGGRVEVVVRSLAEQGFADSLADVERRSGRAEVFGEDVVDGAQRGWVVTVGRSVQVGAADGERLVVAVVIDPALDGVAAREVAIALAGEALR